MTPFHDLAEYMALLRLHALRLSPEGDRLVAVVEALSPDRLHYRTALWYIDPRGVDAPLRLTRSAEGESRPEFRPDGSLLFLSGRPDPGAEKGDEEPEARLWLLPVGGGEPRPIAERPGGIEDYAVAGDTGTVVLASSVLPGADPERAERRKKAGVTATLHESLPIRDWDHQLGPGERRLFVLDGTPRDLTPEPGAALTGQSFAVSPDGATVVTGWWVPLPGGDRRSELVAIDTATGARRTLAAADGNDFTAPVVAPDGNGVVCVRHHHATYDEPPRETLWFTPLDGGPGRDLTEGLDLWPEHPVWAPDSRAVYFNASERGRAPIFRVDVATGEITRATTSDDDAHIAMGVSQDGRHVYALRSAVDRPTEPVRLAETGTAEPLRLHETPSVPGRVTEVIAGVADGGEIRAWLVLPEGASAATPAPLVLWPHGGPHASWTGWHWRWNPWLMAAQGYAVLLPDPALSTGYGQDLIRRGHGQWARPPYEDLMAITDVTVARDEIDGTRTAAMGGSYGGYMANWIAGHTDRFNAIITHASVWKLEDILGSDEVHYFTREFGDPVDHPERWIANDPATSLRDVRTPILVIHGDRDYRVPIGNGLRIWSDLVRQGVDAKFLYFPDENHWILTPGNATVWYETVFAFLAQHLHGEKWTRPDLL